MPTQKLAFRTKSSIPTNMRDEYGFAAVVLDQEEVELLSQLHSGMDHVYALTSRAVSGPTWVSKQELEDVVARLEWLATAAGAGKVEATEEELDTASTLRYEFQNLIDGKANQYPEGIVKEFDMNDLPTTAQCTPAEYIKFRGALYRVALQAIRSPGFLSLPTKPSHQPAKRLHPFSPQQDPSRIQARQQLKQEVVADISALLQHLAESPIGPAELRGKFDQFSSGIALMTDSVKLPLEDGLKNIVSAFRKLLKAKKLLENVQV